MRRGYTTTRKDRGGSGIYVWRWASSVGRRLGCVETGRRCRMGIVGFSDGLMSYDLVIPGRRFDDLIILIIFV